MAELKQEPEELLSPQERSATPSKPKRRRVGLLLILVLLLLLLLYLLWLFPAPKSPAFTDASTNAISTVTRLDLAPPAKPAPPGVNSRLQGTNNVSPPPTDIEPVPSMGTLPPSTLPHMTLPSDVAVVDMARLLAAHPQTSIDADHFKLEKEILAREFERLRAEGKGDEANQFLLRRNREIDLNERNARQKIISEIRGMISTHSKSGKFAIVLDKSGSGSNNTPHVLDAGPSLPDLTEEILKRIRH